MQQQLETNAPFVDLLEILWWRVFDMGKLEACENKNAHINKNEVLALLEDVKEALEGN